MLDAALGYVESSPQWPVFPADPKRKLPLIKTGRDHAEHASTEPTVLRRWIEQDFPGCAIAMPTGAVSGTVVVDVDIKHDGVLELLGELEQNLGPLPRDRVARTQSGGLHIYCAHPGNGVRVRTGQGERSPLGYLTGRAGIDVRADGGIVLLPPSCGYSWIADDDTIPMLPKLWLLAIQGAGAEPPKRSPGRKYIGGRPAWAAEILDDTSTITKGDRNGALFKVAVTVRKIGGGDAEILGEIERHNSQRCCPSLHERELQKIAASAARNPR